MLNDVSGLVQSKLAMPTLTDIVAIRISSRLVRLQINLTTGQKDGKIDNASC